MLKHGLIVGALAAGIVATNVGCESHAGNGALIGGAAGAGIGAIIGNNSKGRTAEGALIGGAVGAIGGGLIGNEMDKKEARQREDDDRYYDERDRDDDRRARTRDREEAYYGQTETRHEEDEDGNRIETYSEEEVSVRADDGN